MYFQLSTLFNNFEVVFQQKCETICNFECADSEKNTQFSVDCFGENLPTHHQSNITAKLSLFTNMLNIHD